MSIKSQKSLYDECSEIIERSYSVRSYSDESLSCDDEDECLARELLLRLTPAALSKLRRSFRRSRERSDAAADIDRRVEKVMRLAAAEEGIEFAAPAPVPADRDALALDESGFVSAIDAIFGNHKYSTHASKLFHLLDPFGTGVVRWRTLLTRLVTVGARRTASRADTWTPLLQGTAQCLQHCKRETLVKLVSIERADSFCYVAVSRGGRVGIYSAQLNLLHSYEVFYHRTGTSRRVKNCWLTDAVYLPDVQCLIYAASDRSLTIYDAATLSHTLTYCITGLPNITTCMAYTATRDGGSELALGSERGDVTRLTFLQSKVSLFYTKSADHVNYYFWMELTTPPHTLYVSIHTWRRVHSRSIRRLAYFNEGTYLVSCSHDSNASVRIRHVPGKIDDYVFKVLRGVSCFHVVPSLQLVCAGGADGCVRLWERTQATPFATLAAPAPPAPVLDLAILAARQIVVAYCSNCYLHIWDMYEECLLQTLKLKFPFLGVLGKKVEFGTFCIHPGPARKPSVEEDPEEGYSPILEVGSRRPSSVYQGSTGGLMLQPEDNEDRTSAPLEEDVEYIRFDRPELLVTCCDFVCVVEVGGAAGVPLPPPGDTLRARRPSFWDLPDDVFRAPPVSPKPPPSPTPLPSSSLSTVPSNLLLSPSSAENPLHDLDTLLENAGLQGILEKDFVLMQGLKHDLNRKLADMKANMDSVAGAVNMGGAYLALRCIEPSPLPPLDEKMQRYKRVLALFPELSLTGTPTVSNTSTPRKRNSSLLCVPSTFRRHNSTGNRL